MFDEYQFEKAWPYLAAALFHAGNTHSKEDLRTLIETKAAILHPLPHGAMVTYGSKHPTGLHDFCYWLAGGDLQEIVKGVAMLNIWAKSENFDRACINGRKGCAKVLPDFKIGSTILYKELR